MSKSITNHQVPSYVASRSDFVSNSGHAKRYTYMPSTGRLMPEWAQQLHSAIETARTAGTDVYVVFSYATPVAWCFAGQWTIPAVKYSQTTTRFQNLVRQGVSTYTETITDPFVGLS